MRPTPSFLTYTVLIAVIASLLSIVSYYLIINDKPAPHVDLRSDTVFIKDRVDSNLTPDEVLRRADWMPLTRAGIASPRKHSVAWLKVKLRNDTADAQDRWLEIAPWRIGDIDVYKYSLGRVDLMSKSHVGMSVPFESRPLSSRRNLVRVQLPPNSEFDVLVRVETESLPTLDVRLWDIKAVLDEDSIEQLLHAALFGSVLVLSVILLLRFDLSFGMLAVWLFSSYAVEAEKGGYMAFYLFNGERIQTVSFGLAFWLLSIASFLCAFAWLLKPFDRKREQHFYCFMIFLCVVMMLVVLFVDKNTARNSCAMFNMLVLLLWPLSLIRFKAQGNTFRVALVLLFFMSWSESCWLVIDYLFNLGFVENFRAGPVLIKLITILGVVGVFSFQHELKRRSTELELLNNERTQKVFLEEQVAIRTLELKRALAAAESAILAKAEFLGRVSYDLRSPLTSIIGYGQLLLSENSRGSRKIGVILKSAGHMLTLVNDLIEHARGVSSDTVEPKATYIYGLLDTIVMEAKILAGRNNNTFQLDISPCLPSLIVVDDKRLRQVIINLVDNAAKYTESGKIGFRVLCEPLDGSLNEVLLMITISDSGCGIPKDDLPKLFTPFYRVANSRTEGAGLGLAIVDHWVTLMGGKLVIDSIVGIGTTAQLFLPVKVAREVDITKRQIVDFDGPVPAYDGRGRVVWIVEDNLYIRELLAQHLTSNNFDVHCAVDGRDCINRLVSKGEAPPSLVLTDYLMPNCSGAELVETLREHWPALPVILISATHQAMQPDSDSTKARFSGYLTKPINLADLRELIIKLANIVDVPHDNYPASSDQPLLEFNILNSEEKLNFNLLVDLGAVSDLVEWAAQLPPDYGALAAYVQKASKAGDLAALRIFNIKS
ncbi:ATP-binding protein [Pseudomonas huaxiensis]|uniref:ATP-binding protein n=1 Tax=Pseudomonas huaxiensis TaxID=2213017 RepID=UPI0015AD5C62|nr:ATP-binding protein [Pseudomonas huaxiensis]